MPAIDGAGRAGRMVARPTRPRRSPARRRFPGRLRGLALAALLLTNADAGDGPLPMAAQIERLAGLGRVVVEPPRWRALVPPDNTETPARVALGRRLYFDPRLSADGSVACASCHDVTRGFTDRQPRSIGIGHQIGRRNAPTTMNVLLLQTLFLDGRAATLEEQATLPILNPIEMGMPDGTAAIRAIEGDPEYRRLFQEAYGRPPNFDDVGRALAAFERTLVFLDAPFDDFARGDAGAISAEARRGWAIYSGRGRCVACHWLTPDKPLGTDHRFHNIGVAARHQDFEALARRALAALEAEDGLEAIQALALGSDLSELGRFMVTRQRADIGAFKTSPLRNVALTAPYMHDGSMATLWDTMDHYNKGGEANPWLAGDVTPLGLGEDEIDAVVAFLFTLTDRRFADENRSELARQRTLADAQRPLRAPAGGR